MSTRISLGKLVVCNLGSGLPRVVRNTFGNLIMGMLTEALADTVRRGLSSVATEFCDDELSSILHVVVRSAVAFIFGSRPQKRVILHLGVSAPGTRSAIVRL